MSIAFHIPAWLLWACGAVIGAGILGLALVGLAFMKWYVEAMRTMGRPF